MTARVCDPDEFNEITVYEWTTAAGETRLRAPHGWGSDHPGWRTVELVEPTTTVAIDEDRHL